LEAQLADREPHYAVQFANRYKLPTDGYLNAWTALVRLDELIEDAKNTKSYLDAAMPEDDRWHPWVGAEIVSYYAVGFVTCLEWHARSRLVDLLTFKPSAARSEDLKIIKDKVVLDMLSANVTVASIVGAATNISSFEDYMNVFSRLFAIFKSKKDAYSAIKSKSKGNKKQSIKGNEIEKMKNLYIFRNDLVHEIGIHRIGHINVRNSLAPADVIEMGELVRRTMLAIESIISIEAPPGFPNMLDKDGVPISEWKQLEKEIPMLENRVAKIRTAFSDQILETDYTWLSAKAASENHIKNEMEFIDNAMIFHNRYVEMREPIKLALIKSRYSYLKSIIEIVGSVWMIDEAAETPLP
jgi:uncharacterized protein (UPF0248 family)